MAEPSHLMLVTHWVPRARHCDGGSYVLLLSSTLLLLLGVNQGIINLLNSFSTYQVTTLTDESKHLLLLHQICSIVIYP